MAGNTFYVDRDGRGGVPGDDSLTRTGWDLTSRVGNASKPFATVDAATVAVVAAGGGDTILVRQQITASELAQITLSGLQPTQKVTIKGYTGERPIGGGWIVNNCQRLRLENFQHNSTMRYTTIGFIDIVDILGRSRSSTSTAAGNMVFKEVNDLLIDKVDVIYRGPTPTVDIVAMNFAYQGGGTIDQGNVTIQNSRFDNWPGDILHPPGSARQFSWKILNNEISRSLRILLADGVSYSHSDSMQIQGDSDDYLIAGNTFYEGVGRLFVMPFQNDTGGAAGGGSHRNMVVQENVWFSHTDTAARFFSCPDLNFVANTVWTAVGNPSRGVQLAFNQGTTQPSTSGTQRVRLKSNILSGLDVMDANVTFTSDSGRNLFPSAASRLNYSKRVGTYADATDGSPTFINASSDASTRTLPNLRLASGSRGVDEGPVIADTTDMQGVPTSDKDGFARVGTRVDIGAYEYGGIVGGGGTGGTGGGVTSGTSGPLLPTTATSNGANGGKTWVNASMAAEKAGADNATVGLTSSTGGGLSAQLDLAFSMSIPSSATTQGFTLDLRRYQTVVGGNVRDEVVQLYANGALAGANKAAGTAWETTPTVVRYGGPTDLWGHATADALANTLRAADFKVVFSARNTNTTTSVAAVDYGEGTAAWSTTAPVPASPPVPQLTITPTNPTNTTLVTFDATTSAGSISIYEISFNGGATFNDMTTNAIFQTSLAAGSYDVVLRVTGSGGVATLNRTLVVTRVSDPTPIPTPAPIPTPTVPIAASGSQVDLFFTPTTLSFSLHDLGPKEVVVARARGQADLKGTISTSATWLSASPSGDNLSTENLRLLVRVRANGMTDGTYTGTITFTPNDSTRTPISVAVTFVVSGVALEELNTYRFSPPSLLSEMIVGPHNILVRNGLTLNDRRGLECFWVNDLQGFESANVRVSSTENTQQRGSSPDPGSVGERVMTLTGWIQAGHYVTAERMRRQLIDAFLGQVELPMFITAATGSMFNVPEVFIMCRPSDRPQVAAQVQGSDISGIIKRSFTIALTASDPVYRSVKIEHASLSPTISTQLGRTYNRVYNLTYNTTIDLRGNPVTGASENLVTVTNQGNSDSEPILRFSGPMTSPTLLNKTNGMVVRLVGDILAGGYIEVDIKNGEIRDHTGANASDRWDPRSDWMHLMGTMDHERGLRMSGENVLSLDTTSAGAGANLDIFWSHVWE